MANVFQDILFSLHRIIELNEIQVSQIGILLSAILPPPPPVAASLTIVWGTPSAKLVTAPNRLFKENLMAVELNPGQTVSFTVSPLDAQGGKSNAVLSNLTFASSDAAVFTVAADPGNPLGGIVTALTPPVNPDAAVLTATALASEPDGTTTETVSGTDTVTVSTPAPPPPPPPQPPVAAALAITWNTPQSPAPVPAPVA